MALTILSKTFSLRTLVYRTNDTQSFDPEAKETFFVGAVVSSISHARPVAFVVCGPNHADYASTLPPSRDQKVSPTPETLQSSKSSKPSHTPKKLELIGDQEIWSFT